MKKKIAISAGGTGGHLFPAVALAQALLRDPSADLLFVGGGLASNRHLDRSVFSFEEIPCGSFAGMKPWSLVRGGFHITRGIMASLSLFRRYRPDIVVGFGSYYAFPPLVAARLLKIPMVLYAADAIPGRVVRLMAPYAEVTGIHLSQTADYLKNRAVLVGMPLREMVVGDRVSAQEARRYFGLDPYKRTLLIFGGSQGAQRLNEMVMESLQLLHNQLTVPIQILHFTGSEAMVDPLKQAYERHGLACCVKAFEMRMGMAWSAADLAIGRSGAGTIAEMQLFEVPAILIPYPYATDAHQDKNADVVLATGGAIKLTQSALTAPLLNGHLVRLLNNQDGRLTAMREAMRQAKKNVPQQSLADLVWETLNKRKAR